MTDDLETYLKKRKEWETLFFKNGFYGNYDLNKNPQWLPNEPPVSRKYGYLLKSLSKTMKEGLKNIIEEKENTQLKTISALRKRNLLKETDNNLTEQGRVLAISLLSLDMQCEILDLDLARISPCDNNQKKIEISVLDYYKKKGYFGFYIEGHLIFEIIKVFIMCTLYPKSIPFFHLIDELRIKFLGSVILSTDFSEPFYNEIIHTIETADENQFIEYFKINNSIQRQSIFKRLAGEMNIGLQEPFPEYDIKEVLLFMRVFKRENFRKIFEKLNKNMTEFSGWPDLLIFNDSEYILVEVKKSDKLIPSQIITLPILKSLGLRVAINKCMNRTNI